MKKLLIFLLALSLLSACNNKNRKDDRKTDRERDDYQDKNTKDKDSKTTDYTNDRTNDNNSSGGWSSADVSAFVDNCVSEAVKGGMQQTKAEDYCTCMQRKLEKEYPDSKDVGNIDINSTHMQDLMRECLGLR